MTTIRPRPRTRMPAEQRREQILAAATVLIAERGYWALSLQDVADNCDLSLAGLLHHFPSKDSLLVAVLDRRDSMETRAVSESLGVELPDGNVADEEADDSPGISLEQACEALVARNAGQPELVRLYAVLEAESLAPDHPAHEYFLDRERQTLRVFRRLVGGEATRAEWISRQLLALMDGLQLQWLRDPDLDLLQAWRIAFNNLEH